LSYLYVVALALVTVILAAKQQQLKSKNKVLDAAVTQSESHSEAGNSASENTAFLEREEG